MAQTTKWEVTIIKLDNDKIIFKVTRRFPTMKVSETKMFTTKKDAKEQFNEWLE